MKVSFKGIINHLSPLLTPNAGLAAAIAAGSYRAVSPHPSWVSTMTIAAAAGIAFIKLSLFAARKSPSLSPVLVSLLPKDPWERFKVRFARTADPNNQLQIALEMLPTIHHSLNKEIIRYFPSDENARFLIAQKAVTFSTESVSEVFDQFQIHDEEKRELVFRELLGRRMPSNFENGAKWFRNYRIENLNTRIEFAKLLADTHQANFFKYVENFDLLDERDRVKVAMSISCNHTELCKHFESLRIVTPAHSFSIARSILPHIIVNYLDKFILTSDEKCQILMKAALSCPIGDRFLLFSDRRQLLNLFQATFEGLFPPSFEFIQKIVQITTPEERFNLAKRDARKWGFPDRLPHYQIDDEKMREELAEIQLLNFRLKREDISKFQITDSNLLRKLELACLIVSPQEHLLSSPWAPHFALSEVQEYFRNGPSHPRSLSSYEKLDDRSKKTLSKTEVRIQILAKILSLSDQEKEALEELARTLFQPSLDSYQREEWSKHIFFSFLDRDIFDFWYKNLPKNREGVPVKHCLLASACFLLLKPNANEYLAWIESLRKEGREVFRNGHKAKLVTELIDSALVNQDKRIIQQIFYLNEDPFERCAMLKSLHSLRKIPDAICSLADLVAIRREGALRVLNLPPHLPVHQLEESRHPHAIFSYILQFSQLPAEQEASLKRVFQSWLIARLSNDYSNWRKTSPHRNQLIERGVSIDLVTKWENPFPVRELQDGEKIVCSDDPEDLFLIGVESGGCQDPIRFDISMSKCLMGYQDWKNRVIAVKDPDSGKILARRLLRLLWNENSQKPVLFLDQCYSFNSQHQFHLNLREYALEVAQEMGLEVYCEAPSGSERDSSNFSPIVSLGSIAPFEFNDSEMGTPTHGETNGRFRIKEPILLTS